MEKLAKSTFQVIDAEIAPKGMRYVICKQYAPDMLDALGALCTDAAQQGARRVCFACHDEKGFLSGDSFVAGDYRFALYSEFYVLQKTIAPQADFRPLKTLPLSEGRALLYRELQNASFFDVPNAQTLGEIEMAQMLADGYTRSGIFLHEGLPCGIYELTLPREDGEPPEIAAIGLIPEYWGKGLGGPALATLEQLLCKMGYTSVTLLVAGINGRAMHLYERSGYLYKRTASRWYDVHVT